jgi:hypothetical protein
MEKIEDKEKTLKELYENSDVIPHAVDFKKIEGLYRTITAL